jgi:RNA polymerase sigma factor (sigma-70 family)
MDPGGFDGVFKSHAPLVWSVLRDAGVPRDDSEDLFLKTWEAVWDSLPSFSGRASLATWIAAIARNKCRDYYRRREPALPADPASIDRMTDAPGVPLLPRGEHLLPPSLRAVARDARAHVGRALTALPPLERTIVTLWMRGFGYDAIAAVVNRTGRGPLCASRVGVLLIRARAALRRILKEAGIRKMRDLL